MKQRKIKTTLVSLVAAFLFLVVFAACGAASASLRDDPLVGAWNDWAADTRAPFLFNADGTGSFRQRGGTVDVTWHRDADDRLILTPILDETQYIVFDVVVVSDSSINLYRADREWPTERRWPAHRLYRD